MKPEEAAASLKTLCHTCELFPKCANSKPECFQAIDMAIEALERQIPKKPTSETDKFIENLCFLYCPTCGSYIGMYNKRLKKGDFFNNMNRKICAECGRSIDCDVE